MFFLRIRFIYLLVVLPFYSLALGGDSSLVSKQPLATTHYYYQHQFGNADSTNGIESSLNNFQNYLPFNHLGNSGLAYNDLVYYPKLNQTAGFNYYKNNYATYFFSPQKIKFYTTRSPYTNLFYATGSKKEQIFRLTFSYNIKKNWNITTDFNRIRSDGFYALQNTNNNSIDVSSNFKSLNNRYYLLAAVIYNSAKSKENGGLTNDPLVTTGTNLDSANRATIERSVFFKQYFNLGKKSTDTTHPNMIEQPTSRFILTSLVENTILKYKDYNPLRGYYPNVYYSNVTTSDSTFMYKVENEFAWKRLDNKKHRGLKDIVGSGFSLKHQYVDIKQSRSDFAFNNFILGAELFNTYSTNKLWWTVQGNYCVSGYNQNNYAASATLKKGIIDSLSWMLLKVENNLQSPDFIYNHNYSNNFFWTNNFAKTNTTRISASTYIHKYKFSVGADYSIYKNVLYFDQTAIAAQNSATIGIVHAFLAKDIHFHNWHLNNKINYNLVPDSSIIRLPELVLEHSLFYANQVFQKAANVQVGASVFYVTSYYANAYMPATAEFYLQNTTLCGNYPAINFFLNAQVKTFRVFIKIDNLNYKWMPNDYVLTPNYTMNGRAFKIGISWMFFD
jgi:hypothetical protein